MRFRLDATTAVLLGTTFDAPKGLSIDSNSVVGRRCRIDTRGGVYIGCNVSISDEVAILTADHDLNSVMFGGRERPVYIEDYAFIGTRAVILPGCRIGKGAVLATGSVLTKAIPDYEIWGGCPARKIGERSRLMSYVTRYQRPFN